jgi:signal transduction histidine kinase
MVNAPAGSTVMLSRWQRYFRVHPWAGGVMLAVVPVFITFPGVMVSVDRAAVPAPLWRGYLLAGISCAALMGVRRYPGATMAATTACAVTLAAVGYTLTPLLLTPVMVALFFVAMRTGQKVVNVCTVAAIMILVSTALIASPAREPVAMEVIGTIAWLLLSSAAGGTARLRLAYMEAANARAEYAERTREEEALHRVADERMRIARELHDVVAHHMALAHAQVTTVAYLIDSDPGKARAMAGDLDGTIVAALEELKNTVGLLRRAGDPGSPLEPAPGLAQLPDLAASFRSAGLIVTITTSGQPEPLPAGVDLTAYRIIQEALTNVTKHAATSQAQVRLSYGEEWLTITIVNDSSGPRPPAGRPGYGLIGMRERAQSAGGRLHAGHRPEGGFEVAAELPLHSRRPHGDPS